MKGLAGLLVNGLKDMIEGAQVRGTILGNNAAPVGGSEDDAADAAKAFFCADLIGLTGVNNAIVGSDSATGEQLTAGQRWLQGITGAIQMFTFGWNMTSGLKPSTAAEEGPLCPNSTRGGCFPAGTLVGTESGYSPIEKVQFGERVWACDLTTGKWIFCPIIETYRTEYIGDLIAIAVAGEVIESTYHHPFWVIEGVGLEERPRPDHVERATVHDATVTGRWVDAGDLKVCDVLLLMPDRRVHVNHIETRRVRMDVYNFEVNALHNYAVGEGRVLVHNTAWCPGDGPPIDRPRMSPGEAAENGLMERDEGWLQRGLHETEEHHPLMQGDEYAEFWEERGWSRQAVRDWHETFETDIHRAIEEGGWWPRQMLADVADAEANLLRKLNADEVRAIADKLLAIVRIWAG